MREDDDFGHYVPLLRRLIILVAVIIAVPVILWTITVFVRTYVGPPHVPTAHQLASTASINAPSAGAGQDTTGATNGAGTVVEARASVTDAHDGAAAQGSMPTDRDADAGAPGSDAAGVFPPSPLAAPDGSAATSAQASPTDNGNETLSASQPLSGPIPLPRRRPREAAMYTADSAPSNVPMPRRRPDAVGSSGQPETTGSNPIGFIQNLFH